MDPITAAIAAARRRPDVVRHLLRPTSATIVARYLARGLPRNAG